VVLAGAAAAAGAGTVAAAGAGAGAGSGGGIGTSTLVIAGGAVAAAGLVAAVARGGSDGEEACLNAREIAAQAPGQGVAVDDRTFCSTDVIPCRGGLTVRACLSGLCTSSCSVYYEFSDSRRITCGSLPDCFAGDAAAIQDPSFCLSAARQVAEVCN
jgi:hypothetical protein